MLHIPSRGATPPGTPQNQTTRDGLIDREEMEEGFVAVYMYSWQAPQQASMRSTVMEARRVSLQAEMAQASEHMEDQGRQLAAFPVAVALAGAIDSWWLLQIT